MTFDGSNKSEHASNRREYFNEKLACKRCGKMIRRGNMTTHRKTKKCKNFDDKTAGKDHIRTPLSNPPAPGSLLLPEQPAEHSKILKEINMNQEFDKMSEKFNSGKKDEDKEKKFKFKCECGAYFNYPANVNGKEVCPECGQ